MKKIRFRYDDKVYSGILSDGIVRSDAGLAGALSLELGKVDILAPVTPGKIICVGLNYHGHAREMNMAIPENPVIFLKPPTSVIGHGGNIVFPEVSRRVDYEAELAVVIKARASKITKQEAASHILGYTCFNDVTARDIQRIDGQWTRAKSFDTFAPIGPWIETDIDTSDIAIESYLNGELKQSSRTSDLIKDIPSLVSFVSSVMTLLPGDVIATGTPAGIGPMLPGDTIEIKIEGIGTLSNKVILP